LSSEGYKVIIDRHLGPFMNDFLHGDCRLLQDNAPTHVTDLIYDSLRANNIRWVKNYVKCQAFIFNKFILILKRLSCHHLAQTLI
jgi:hypothetical protein